MCCSVLQCDEVCCSVLQCAAVYCSVLQCVAVCCSAKSLQTNVLDVCVKMTKEQEFQIICTRKVSNRLKAVYTRVEFTHVAPFENKNSKSILPRFLVFAQKNSKCVVWKAYSHGDLRIICPPHPPSSICVSPPHPPHK